MLNAGQLSRVGPQRLYVKAARRWVEEGIAVLRLDLAGVGDSEAENTEIHFDNHSPDEVAAAIRYLRERLNPESLFIQGLCAGARTAIRSAAEDERITGILAWSCPIYSAGEGSPQSPFQTPDHTTDWSARDSFSKFLSSFTKFKFFTWKWWRNRIVHGAGELRQLGRAIKHMIVGSEEVTNPFLAAADRCLDKGRNVLFIFGERDRMPLEEFQQRFANVPESELKSQGYWIVPNGTHTFSSFDAQETVIGISGAWMLAHCGSSPRQP